MRLDENNPGTERRPIDRRPCRISQRSPTHPLPLDDLAQCGCSTSLWSAVQHPLPRFSGCALNSATTCSLPPTVLKRPDAEVAGSLSRCCGSPHPAGDDSPRVPVYLAHMLDLLYPLVQVRL